MKALCIALLIHLLLTFSASAQRKPDRERDGFIGPVKSVYVESAELSIEEGKLVEKPPFESGGEESYNKKGWGPWGKKPRGGGYGMSHNGSHGEYIFDVMGNKIQTIHYSGDDTIVGRDFYKYDDSGNEVEEARYNADGKLKERTIQVYDSKGKRVEKAIYSGDGVMKENLHYTNDKSGNVIEEEVFDSNGLKERRRFTYEFDSVGNWTKRTSYIEVTKDGQPTLEPEVVTRRKIKYY